MQEIMQAVAQSLRNLGFSDATSGRDYVRVRECEFSAYSCSYMNKRFTFLGRTYRSGNVMRAVLDLIRELPQRLAQIEERKLELSKEKAAVALTKSLDDPDMKVTYYNGKFTFTYSCTDLSGISQVAERIAKEMAIASEQAWNEIVLESKTNPSFARFTAEGGFILN